MFQCKMVKLCIVIMSLWLLGCGEDEKDITMTLNLNTADAASTTALIAKDNRVVVTIFKYFNAKIDKPMLELSFNSLGAKDACSEGKENQVCYSFAKPTTVLPVRISVPKSLEYSYIRVVVEVYQGKTLIFKGDMGKDTYYDHYDQAIGITMGKV